MKGGRPRTVLGTYGAIHVVAHDGRYTASTRYRDLGRCGLERFPRRVHDVLQPLLHTATAKREIVHRSLPSFFWIRG